MKELTQKRNYALDVIRLVAILLVVMVHCTATFVTAYKPGMREFAWGTLLNGITRPGVPLFLMISGSLFLDESKEVTIKAILRKKVISLAVITIVWSVVYTMAYNVMVPLLAGKAVDRAMVVNDILNGHGHMWYLYMIMGLYVITPFLKEFVCKENKKMVLLFIGVSFVVQFLTPVVDEICMGYWDRAYLGPWLDKFYLDFFGGFITYYLTGWYMVHVGIQEKSRKYLLYFLGIGSLVFMIMYVQSTTLYKTIYGDISAPVYLYSVSVFQLLNDIKFDFKEKTANILTGLSKLSFGVYIIHVLVLNVFMKVFPYRGHCVPYIFLSFAGVTCASVVSVYIMSKIPLIKKLIKM